MKADTKYLTTEDLAAPWKCSTWSLNQWAKAGRITGAVKMGNAWRREQSPSSFTEGAAAGPRDSSGSDNLPDWLAHIPNVSHQAEAKRMNSRQPASMRIYSSSVMNAFRSSAEINSACWPFAAASASSPDTEVLILRAALNNSLRQDQNNGRPSQRSPRSSGAPRIRR